MKEIWKYVEGARVKHCLDSHQFITSVCNYTPTLHLVTQWKNNPEVLEALPKCLNCMKALS